VGVIKGGRTRGSGLAVGRERRSKPEGEGRMLRYGDGLLILSQELFLSCGK
jgi:hypothetical protein